jgi:succinyl-CoA synthetase beta subunit
MKIHEYQGKKLISEYGLPVARDEIARSPKEAANITERLGLKELRSIRGLMDIDR